MSGGISLPQSVPSLFITMRNQTERSKKRPSPPRQLGLVASLLLFNATSRGCGASCFFLSSAPVRPIPLLPCGTGFARASYLPALAATPGWEILVDNPGSDESDDGSPLQGPEDTVRVRIWRALAPGGEMSLPELTEAVNAGSGGGDRVRITHSDLRYHLSHVERQAKTLGNKSGEWRERRGLSRQGGLGNGRLRLRKRRGGPRGETFVKLHQK